MFGARRFLYYMNKLVGTKVDFTSVYVAASGRKPVTSRLLVRRLAECTTHVDIEAAYVSMHSVVAQWLYSGYIANSLFCIFKMAHE